MTEQQVLDHFNKACENTLMNTLNIRYTKADLEAGTLTATMPVGPQVHQPMGILQGGATVALAESVGSAASLLHVDPQESAPVGAEISANHVKSAKTGTITATATPVHIGRSSHLFDIRVENENGELISIVRLLNFIKKLK